MPHINLWGVIAAGAAGMAVGALWYGPVFGKLWMKLMGFTKESAGKVKKKGMALSYGLGFLGQLAAAYALALLIAFTFQYFSGFSYSVIFWVWLGGVVPAQMAGVLREGRSWPLFLLNSAYYLVQMGVMGLVLSYLG